MDRVIRDDLSNRLIHLTKGKTDQNEDEALQSAAEDFWKIITTRKIIGGNGFIKSNHKCVCFSETPISKIGILLAAAHKTFRYQPYGIMFRKKFIYSKGGRPVIYQSDNEFNLLREENKHLHVRYEPDKNIDFTWEREWRIKIECIEFLPEDVTLIIPNRQVADSIRNFGYEEQKENIRENGIGAFEDFPWHFITLEDLGVDMADGWFKTKSLPA